MERPSLTCGEVQVVRATQVIVAFHFPNLHLEVMRLRAREVELAKPIQNGTSGIFLVCFFGKKKWSASDEYQIWQFGSLATLASKSRALSAIPTNLAV